MTANSNSQFVLRKNLIKYIDSLNPKANQPIVFIAQSGQGKTTTINQLLSFWESKYIFISIKRNDSIEWNFFSDIYLSLKNAIPGFNIDLVEEMILNGTLLSIDPDKFTSLIIRNIKASPNYPFFIVFDDIHQISQESPVIQCIVSFVNRLNRKIRMILSMRFIRDEQINKILSDNHFMIINNEKLAFNKDEVFEYMNSIAQLPCSAKEINKLYTVTEGWIMGILIKTFTLQFHSKQKRNFQSENPMKISNSANVVFRYFENELFNHIPLYIIKYISLLSLLDEIRESFLKSLSKFRTIIDTLNVYIEKNFFIKRIVNDHDETVYIFHHLFQDCLNQFAIKQSSIEERNDLYLKAAEFYLSENNFEITLKYLIKAGHYTTAQNVLKKIGTKLIDEDRIATLYKELNQIPKDTLLIYPWFSFFYGYFCLNINPQESKDYFYSSINLFRQQKDEVGELLTTAQTIFYHVSVDGHFNMGSQLIERAISLFQKIEDDLTIISRIHSAISIAAGLTMIASNFELADEFVDKAKKDSEQHSLITCRVIAVKVKGFIHAIRGDFKKFNSVLEEIVPYFNDARLSLMGKVVIWLSRMNLLQLEGDFYNYEFYKDFLLSHDRYKIIDNTLFGPFLLIWEIDIAIAKGDYHIAENFIHQGLQKSLSYANPHLKSQFLYYQAYINAVLGKKAPALEAAGEALKLREIAGGVCFDILCSTCLCGAFAHLNMDSECKYHFERAIKLSLEVKENIMHTGAYSHIAYLHLRTDHPEKATPYIKSLLVDIEKDEKNHFFCLDPKVMQLVLTYAVKNKIQEAFAAKFAKKRLNLGFSPEGDPIPLLQINILGSFSIQVNKKTILVADNLSKILQKFLSCLLLSDHYSMDSDKMASYIWPEANNVGNNLGITLNRLKNCVKKIFESNNMDFNHYFQRINSRVILKNCVTDKEIFLKNVFQGFHHIKNKHNWQAENYFRIAFHYWKGELCSDFQYCDNMIEHDYELKMQYDKASDLWSEIIIKHGTIINDDLCKLEKAIKCNNLKLSRNLYKLYSDEENILDPQRIVSLYRNEIEKTYDNPADISSNMNLLWEDDTSL